MSPSKLTWDNAGERLYETGVDRGVLYLPNETGVYDKGVAWNGLTTVTESPSGAEASAQYADNIKYLNLISAEDFGGTIEAFTYPTEFEACDGTASPKVGVTVGQQTRVPFGLSYRTLIGNDLKGTDYGYKLHIVYNALAAPSEKARATVNDSPEALSLSWAFTTTAVPVGEGFKPSATITIDSTKVDADDLAALEALLYGTSTTAAALPTPAEVIALFGGPVTPHARIQSLRTNPDGSVDLTGNAVTPNTDGSATVSDDTSDDEEPGASSIHENSDGSADVTAPEDDTLPPTNS